MVNGWWQVILNFWTDQNFWNSGKDDYDNIPFARMLFMDGVRAESISALRIWGGYGNGLLRQQEITPSRDGFETRLYIL